MKPRSPISILCSSLALSACILAFVDPAIADNTTVIKLKEVVLQSKKGTTNSRSYKASRSSTATRTETPVLQIPQAVTTVTAQAIKDKAAKNLDDVLSTVSGVTQANTIGGVYDAVIRRGFGESSDDSILTDGLNTVLPHSFNATTDYVDVLKGPASTLYGILDPGGMINVVTKKPQDTFSAEAWSTFSAYGAGRYSSKAGVDITGPVTNTGFSYRLITEGEDGDYWRNFGTNKNWLIAPSFKWENDGTQLLVSYTHQNYVSPYDRGTVYDAANGRMLDISPRERLDEKWSKIDGDSDLFKTSLTRQLGGDWKFSLNYGFSRNSFEANQTRPVSYNAKTGMLNRSSDVRGYDDTKEHAVRADLTGSEDLFGLKNEFLFGSALRDKDISRSALQRCNKGARLDVYDPEYGTISPCTYNASGAVEEYEHLLTTSLYGQDRVHLTDQLTAVGGVRLEHYGIKAGSGDTVNTDTAGYAFVPNAGLVWQFRPDMSLYTNVAKTFRPNVSINRPYGSLDPEQGVSYEVGSKVDITDGLSGNLALYYSEKQNVAYAETTANGDTIYRTAGRVRSKGVELDIAGQLTDNLQMVASYGFTDAVVVDDATYAGNGLANVARNTAALRLAYDYGQVFDNTGRLRFGGGVRAVGKRPGDAANSFDLPAYGVVDLFASYTIERKHPIEINLNLNNLFNKTYYPSSMGNSPFGVAVGEPFSAALTLRVKY
ncbi:TonB-dependent siderophore receptor [Jiella sp. MQZ9-1]|uniref:TonB-dependent siderophore receptor n=1 Tax=Jiella flava TaxID=2816857 RepID=A0A939FW64_9HYPH|nr:TonB-dependent siderophore receptor [Jiella flava]MBO0661891.1 TonB-dependent siderophore receptor [Jiella flava]MCD2470781.1 TonB-dependent siderophore receptor [Jiella flava]